MQVNQIVAELDQEINRLKEARALLAGAAAVPRRRGRPASKQVAAPRTTRKHRLSPEGRKRISDALKRRWAKQRKAKSGKAA